MWHYTPQRISIDANIQKGRKLEVLFHELTHCWFSGFCENFNEEVACLLVGRGMLDLITRNLPQMKQLIAWVEESGRPVSELVKEKNNG